MSVISQRGGSSSINEMSVYMRESLTGPDFSKPISPSRFSGNRQAGAQLPYRWRDLFSMLMFQSIHKDGLPLPVSLHLCVTIGTWLVPRLLLSISLSISSPWFIVIRSPRFPGDTGNPLRHARKRSCLSSSPADREMRITAVFFIFIILFSIYLFVCLFGLANAAELRALVVLSLALCL